MKRFAVPLLVLIVLLGAQIVCFANEGEVSDLGEISGNTSSGEQVEAEAGELDGKSDDLEDKSGEIGDVSSAPVGESGKSQQSSPGKSADTSVEQESAGGQKPAGNKQESIDFSVPVKKLSEFRKPGKVKIVLDMKYDGNKGQWIESGHKFIGTNDTLLIVGLSLLAAASLASLVLNLWFIFKRTER